MTYLLPDDWYANHGLAPGDARLPQPNMQPVPGGLAPTPPMRGYYGPRPPQPALYAGPARTVSPMAVSDQMWGVNGLGALPVALPCPCGARQVGMTRDGWCVCARGHHFTTMAGPPRAGLGAGTAPSRRRSRATLGADPLVANAPPPPAPGVIDPKALDTAVSQSQANAAAVIAAAAAQPSLNDQTNAIMAQAADRMKQQAMAGAAANVAITAGITAGLAAMQFVPIVGQVTAIVYGVIMAVIGTMYEKKAKKVLADVQNKVNDLAAKLTLQYSQAQADTIKQETPVAIQLLLSGAPLAGWGGMGGYDGMGNILDSAWNSISTQVNRAVTAVDINARRATNAVIAAAQTVDGDAILKRAQAAADAAYGVASSQMIAQFNAHMAQLKDPAFLHALDVYLAKQFQADPNYVALADKNAILQAGADGTITGVTVATPKTDMLIPGLTAAGITLAVLTL